MYRTSSGNNRDIGQIVRRWGHKFAGEPGESIDTFLEGVEESWELAKLSDLGTLQQVNLIDLGAIHPENKTVVRYHRACAATAGARGHTEDSRT